MQETLETRVWSLSQEDPLEKGMATNSSIFAWGIPWTEEPGKLQSVGGHKKLDRLKWLSMHAHKYLDRSIHLKLFLGWKKTSGIT